MYDLLIDTRNDVCQALTSISLPYFSKILQYIMYNRLYTHLIENQIFFNKQFVFRAGHSINHALLDLRDQICKFDEKNLC